VSIVKENHNYVEFKKAISYINYGLSQGRSIMYDVNNLLLDPDSLHIGESVVIEFKLLFNTSKWKPMFVLEICKVFTQRKAENRVSNIVPPTELTVDNVEEIEYD
jgi:hypothetical protein